PQRAGIDEGRVAVEDDHGSLVARERVASLLDRVARPLLLGLYGNRHLAAGKRRFDLLAALAEDHDLPFGPKRVDPVEEVEQQWPAGDGMEHLVRIRTHARSLPGGEDDHGETALLGHGALQWHGGEWSARHVSAQSKGA